MLEPLITNTASGIRKAAERVFELVSRILGAAEGLLQLFHFIDATGGSGGGLFRYMYGRYLKEAAGIASQSQLSAVGGEFKYIGDRWQEVAEIFKRASGSGDPAALLPNAAELLLVIADLEEAAWNRLAGIAG
jgi:hypothetical protein